MNRKLLNVVGLTRIAGATTKAGISAYLGVDVRYVDGFDMSQKFPGYAGFIVRERGDYMGTLVVPRGRDNVVIRGYPKMHYLAEESTRSAFVGKRVYAEVKYRGSNVCAAFDDRLPVSTYGVPGLLLKSRLTSYLSTYGEIDFRASFRKAAERIMPAERLARMLSDENLQVFFELFGQETPTDLELAQLGYETPKVDVDIRLLDAVDRATMCFVGNREKRALADRYGFKAAEVEFELDMVSDLELLRSTVRMEQTARERKYEGYVLKAMHEGDQVFAKVKPEEVRAIYFDMASPLVGLNAIKQAAAKAQSELGADFLDREKAVSFVRQDLAEEWAQTKIDASTKRIAGYVNGRIEVGRAAAEIVPTLEAMRRDGVDISDRNTAMRELTRRMGVGGRSPGYLYELYQTAMARVKRSAS